MLRPLAHRKCEGGGQRLRPELGGYFLEDQPVNPVRGQAVLRSEGLDLLVLSGDRYVLEMLTERGWKFGGENSGHILCLDQHTTGDAIVAALQVLRALCESASTLAQACAPVALYPQVMINVPVKRRGGYQEHSGVSRALQQAEGDLGSDGRVLLRPSGTEPVIRVMVEAKSRAKAGRWAEAIAGAVRAAD